MAGLAGALWYLERHGTLDADRLYWEYAGRMLHAPVTHGYIEWVQHRVGVPPALGSAARAATRLAPYTGFPCEYPPGSLLLFALIRYFSDDLAGFSRSFQYCSAAIFVAVMLLTLRYVRKLYLAAGDTPILVLYAIFPLIALSPILIGPFAVNRFDMLPTFFAVAGLALFLEDRPLGAAFLLGMGAATKLWPGLLLPLIAAQYCHAHDRASRLTMMAGLGIAGFALPHLVVIALGTNPADAFRYLKFLGDRPPQIESMVANIGVILAHLTGSPVSGGFDFGSQNIYSRYTPYVIRIATVTNAALLVGAFVVLLGRSMPGRDKARVEVTTVFACGFAVCVTILCSRVFSGEYMMWPLPFALFLLIDKRGAIGAAAFVLSLVLLKATYWAYDGLIDVKLPGTLVSFSKNLMLAVVAAILGARMIAFGRGRTAVGRLPYPA